MGSAASASAIMMSLPPTETSRGGRKGIASEVAAMLAARAGEPTRNEVGHGLHFGLHPLIPTPEVVQGELPCRPLKPLAEVAVLHQPRQGLRQPRVVIRLKEQAVDAVADQAAGGAVVEGYDRL